MDAARARPTTPRRPVPGPFLSRFTVREHLESLSLGDLAQIAKRAIARTPLEIDLETATEVAKLAHGIPREAIKLSKRIADLAVAKRVGRIDAAFLAEALRTYGIDERGLDPIAQKALAALERNGHGRAMGLSRWAAASGLCPGGAAAVGGRAAAPRARCRDRPRAGWRSARWGGDVKRATRVRADSVEARPQGVHDFGLLRRREPGEDRQRQDFRRRALCFGKSPLRNPARGSTPAGGRDRVVDHRPTPRALRAACTASRRPPVDADDVLVDRVARARSREATTRPSSSPASRSSRRSAPAFSRRAAVRAGRCGSAAPRTAAWMRVEPEVAADDRVLVLARLAVGAERLERLEQRRVARHRHAGVARARRGSWSGRTRTRRSRPTCRRAAPPRPSRRSPARRPRGSGLRAAAWSGSTSMTCPKRWTGTIAFAAPGPRRRARRGRGRASRARCRRRPASRRAARSCPRSRRTRTAW